MRWKKAGLVFESKGQYPWMQSHAANPTPEYLGGRTYRVYFSCRDGQQRSHIAAAIVELGEAPRLLDLQAAPVLAPGLVGCFDDSGTSMGCLLQVGDDTYLYYVGWNLGVTVPWRNSIGLAIRRKGAAHFERHSLAPVMDRHAVDPYSLSYPCILPHPQGGYMAWYGSNLTWGPTQAHMVHVIKTAHSANGIDWQRSGHIAIDGPLPEQYAFSRPCVLHEGGTYKMWYTWRGQAYRIGYAESGDGLHWQRRDELAGIAPSATGWDSEMIAYAWVFDHEGQKMMLYNGNAYGKTGFGLALAG